MSNCLSGIYHWYEMVNDDQLVQNGQDGTAVAEAVIIFDGNGSFSSHPATFTASKYDPTPTWSGTYTVNNGSVWIGDTHGGWTFHISPDGELLANVVALQSNPNGENESLRILVKDSNVSTLSGVYHWFERGNSDYYATLAGGRDGTYTSESVITFDGAGSFSWVGISDSEDPAGSFGSFNGTYTVANGIVTISVPNYVSLAFHISPDGEILTNMEAVANPIPITDDNETFRLLVKTGEVTPPTPPPTAEITDNSLCVTGHDTLSFTISGTDVTAYKYKLDNGAYSSENPTSSKLTVSGLQNGIHTISVIAKNSANSWQLVDNATSITWQTSLNQKGDINKDGCINLQDVILSLQVPSCIAPSMKIYPSAESSGDGAIGLEDTSYIIQAAIEHSNDGSHSVLPSQTPLALAHTTWFSGTSHSGMTSDGDAIVFIDDTHYLHIKATDNTGSINCGEGASGIAVNGIDFGTYNLDNSTNSISTTSSYTNMRADCGFGSLPQTKVIFDSSANTLTYNETTGNSLLTMGKITSATNPIVGSWGGIDPATANTAGDMLFIVFLDDSNFLFVQKEPTPAQPDSDSCGHTGIERGTYTWDQGSKLFTANSVIDTTGCWGVRIPWNNTGIETSDGVTISIANRTATLSWPAEGSFTIPRID